MLTREQVWTMFVHPDQLRQMFADEDLAKLTGIPARTFTDEEWERFLSEIDT